MESNDSERDALRALIGEREKKSFAKAIGLSGGASMLSQHLSGHRPISLDAGVCYANGLGVPLESFSPRLAELARSAVAALDTTDRPPQKPIPLTDNPEYPAVKRAAFKLSAGVSGYAVEVIEDNTRPIVFRRDWYELNGYNPSKLFAVRVSGSSMEPMLFDGDLVVINTAQTGARDGHVFAVNYGGELVIKRLHLDAGQWWVRSDNQDKRLYPDKRMYEGASLIGEAVYRQSERL